MTTPGGLYIPTVWSTQHFLRHDTYCSTHPPPGRLLAFASAPQGKSFTDNREWKNKRVLLLCDLIGAGMGDRVLLAQLAHAFVAAGAVLTCAYTCPPGSWKRPAQHSMRTIMHYLFPFDAATTRAFAPEQHDFLAWMVGYCWAEIAKLRLGGARHMGEFAEHHYGLDLNARGTMPDPEPIDVPRRYALVQVTASMHANALEEALQVAQRRRAEEERTGTPVPLFAIGHLSGACPAGVIDGYRGQPLAELFTLIKGAQWGIGPDSGPSHIAGLYGTPWTAVRAGGERARWWLGHYPSVEVQLR